MKKRILSLALTLALCLGLTVPAFAETWTETVDGITVTANSNGTISYTGLGTLTEVHAKYGIEMIYTVTKEQIRGKTVTISIGANVIYGENWLAEMKELFSVNDLNAVISNSSTTAQTVGGFTDVKESDYFAKQVLWAVEKKITSGTTATTFSPGKNCSVAEILTFLYQAYGAPKSSGSNPFTDVKESAWYYNAARWAYEKGIVPGGTFGGSRPCTRAMAVDYMWKAAGSPNSDFDIINQGTTLHGYHGKGGDVVIPSGITKIVDGFSSNKTLTSITIPVSVTEIDDFAFSDSSLTDIYYEGSQEQWDAITVSFNTGGDWAFMDTQRTVHFNSKMPQQTVNTGFTDVPATADYAQAVSWAVEKGVTGGTSETTFSPDKVCTRGQIVTFLYAALG